MGGVGGVFGLCVGGCKARLELRTGCVPRCIASHVSPLPRPPPLASSSSCSAAPGKEEKRSDTAPSAPPAAATASAACSPAGSCEGSWAADQSGRLTPAPRARARAAKGSSSLSDAVDPRRMAILPKEAEARARRSSSRSSSATALMQRHRCHAPSKLLGMSQCAGTAVQGTSPGWRSAESSASAALAAPSRASAEGAPRHCAQPHWQQPGSQQPRWQQGCCRPCGAALRRRQAGELRRTRPWRARRRRSTKWAPRDADASPPPCQRWFHQASAEAEVAAETAAESEQSGHAKRASEEAGRGARSVASRCSVSSSSSQAARAAPT